MGTQKYSMFRTHKLKINVSKILPTDLPEITEPATSCSIIDNPINIEECKDTLDSILNLFEADYDNEASSEQSEEVEEDDYYHAQSKFLSPFLTRKDSIKMRSLPMYLNINKQLLNLN